MEQITPPAFVKKILNKIAEKNGFKDSPMNFQHGAQPGDAFNSHIVRGTITKGDENMHVLYKIAPNHNPTGRIGINTNVMFINEVKFYNDVLPELLKFQKDKGLVNANQFSLVPKCHEAVANVANKEFAVVLEDLHKQGFVMWNRSQPSTLANVTLAMRELGKFHAVSIAMRDQEPEKFAKIQEMTSIADTFLDTPALLKMFDTSLERAIKVLKSDKPKLIYHQIRKNIKEQFEKCLKPKDGSIVPLGVLAHGDFWSNNCLYRTQNPGVASDIRILDWQTVGYTTPAIDVLFNLFISTDHKTRQTEFEKLVQVYHKTVSDTVKALGSDPAKLFKFEDLDKEMKRVGVIVLLVAPYYMQLLQASEAALKKWNATCDDINNQSGEQQELYDLLSEDERNAYADRINDVVDDVVVLGFVDGLL
jgi:thiamine kinase-like enzyme